MPFIWNASSCLCWALSFPKDKSPSKKLLTSGLHQQLGHKLFHVFKSPEQNRAANFSSSAVGWNELRELLTSKHRQHLHLVQKADVHFTPSFSPVSIELNYTNYLEHLKELKPQNETSQKTVYGSVLFPQFTAVSNPLQPKCWKKCIRFHPASWAGCTSAVSMAKLYPELTFPLFYVPPSIE